MKTLTIREVIKVVEKGNNDIDDLDQFKKFFRDLVNLVTDHFGGTFDPATIRYDNDKDDWVVTIERDENLPDGETIYDAFDRKNKL